MTILSSRHLHFNLLLIIFFSHSTCAEINPKIKTVATFSILGDMVKNIGGDRIALFVLVGPNSDGHVFQPTPQDAKKLATANILFSNGLGFEGWIDRLVEASGFRGPWIVATKGIKPLVSDLHTDAVIASKAVDPHAWQSLANARIYANNIAAAFIAVDPNHRDLYSANLATYLEKIKALEQKIIAAVAALPSERRRVITSHDAFKYFEAAYGLRFNAPQGLSTNAEASARDVAALIRQIRAEKTPAIFVENVTDRRLIEQITRETGAAVGGTLYSDALSEKNQPADTYLQLMLHNATLLTEALSR